MEENKVAIQLNYKAFEMIQDFKNDPEKRLRLYDLIFDCSFMDKEINDEDMAVRMTAKSILLDIEQCRNNYIEKCKNNAKYGIQGKEYGIQGKDYGKLGGRPRKGESPEDYIIRKKGDCEWTQAFKKIKQDQELIEKIKTNSVSTETIEELSKEYSKDTVIDVMRWIKEKN